MKISDLAKQTNISKRNIHFYVQKGLLTPAITKENGYYDFSEEDVQRLCLIRDFRKLDLSLNTIHSILEHPDTCGFYLNMHSKKIHQKIRCLAIASENLDSIINKLPLHPNLTNLASLLNDTSENNSFTEPVSNVFTENDNEMVNRFLWCPFLDTEHLTDYQQFLWEKIKQLSITYYLEDYKKIKSFLTSFDDRFSNEMYVTETPHYNKVAKLSENESIAFGNTIITYLEKLPCHQQGIQFWKKYYDTFYIPIARINDSQIGTLLKELSPMYCIYKKNTELAAQTAYDYLSSKEGKTLKEQLENCLGDFLDLEDFKHAQLIQLYCISAIPLHAL
ncbi:MAG: MerR family transcriptional regulator [Lachnospiraceae bacterium]|nr:MerR family transcriptional regulator [Lachnospiraceae bacterium]